MKPWLCALVLLAAACEDDNAPVDQAVAADLAVAHDAAVCSPLSSIDGGTPGTCPSCDPLGSGACTTPLSCGTCTGDSACRYGSGTVCSCVGGTLHCGAARTR